MGGGVSKHHIPVDGQEEEGSAIYEVNFDMDVSLSHDFNEWILNHTKDLRNFQGFQKCEYFKQKTNKPTVVFVLGGPGSGKGTQCERIVKNFGFGHISAGDCLREEQASGSSDAELINQYIKEGKLVPIDIVIKLLIKAMNKSDKDKFLIDGFPRSVENLEGWITYVGDKANVAFVLYLDCPENVMEQRLIERGKTSGRADDNIETIKKRFYTFQNETKPIVEIFKMKNKLRYIKAEKELEEVWNEVKNVFTELDAHKDHRVSYTIHYRFDKFHSLLQGEKEIEPQIINSFPPSLVDKVQILTRYLLNSKEL